MSGEWTTIEPIAPGWYLWAGLLDDGEAYPLVVYLARDDQGRDFLLGGQAWISAADLLEGVWQPWALPLLPNPAEIKTMLDEREEETDA